MTEAPALPAMTLGDMQHWVSVVGRMQQMLMEFSLRQMGKVPELLTKGPEAGGTMNMHLPDLSQANILAKWFEAADPAKLIEMQKGFWTEATSLWSAFLTPGQQPPEQAPVKDRRFADKSWESNPVFDVIRRSYLLLCEHLLGGVQHLDGLPEKDRQRLRFATETVLDAISPSNFPLTNPRVIERTLETRGDNLLHGLEHMLHDLDRGQLTHSPETAFEVGRNIAATPGKVVHENAFYQLIQYTPTTPDVLKQPLIIFPPWINRFYILDLSPEKSFIKWAVDQGVTVFVVSWKSADESMADTTQDDYVMRGQVDAIDTVRDLLGVKSVHCIGYCVAGTTLAMTLAVLAARGEADKVATATFFTAQVDFSEAGDLCIFIDEQQLELVEQLSKEHGYLDGRYMAATFNLLRGRDLIWNYVVNNYLLGQDYMPFDLLHWNGDTTNLPAKWHGNYLRDLYRDNKLVQPGALSIDGTPLDLRKIKTPAYIQAGIDDHIAPANSVWKIMDNLAGEKRFLLAGSGHIAGVVNPPAAQKYQYWRNDAPVQTLAEFRAGAVEHKGSWWPDWIEWIAAHSAKKRVKAEAARIPGQGSYPAIEDAPGRYVKSR
jgi:polyhydroxyalkanoate synthase